MSTTESQEARAERMRRWQERTRLCDKIDRYVTTASSYLKGASRWLYAEDKDLDISPRYWDLLDQALVTATEIVEKLPDSFFEFEPLGDPFGMASRFGWDQSEKFSSSDRPLEEAEKLVAMLHKRRKRTGALRVIRALEAVEGRGPEEAAAYLAKAAELRAKLEEES